MDFNFNISTESAVRNTRRQLEPWKIHEVEFKGMEVREFQGKKDPEKTYKTLQVNFENEEGYFNVVLWFPKEGDTMRRSTTTANGGTRMLPSTFETMWATLKQTVEVLVPGGLDKLKVKIPKCKSFDDIAKVVIAITDPAKGTKTNIKLIGRNRDGKVVSEIPSIISINNTMEVSPDSNNDHGEAFIGDNYLGKNLYFTNYEEKQIKAYNDTKPTKMPDEPKVTNVDQEESIDDLLADL